MAEQTLHYGDEATQEYEQTRQFAGLFDLSQRSKVELTGPDAAAFLHNLCTNDIKNLPPGSGCEFFLTTHKAKVVSHGYVYCRFPHDNRPALWLDLAPGQGETVVKHLDHYLISEQVELADRTREFAQFQLAGPAATSILARALADDVPQLAELQHVERALGAGAPASVRRHDALNLPGYDIVCPRERAAGVWEMLLSSGAKPARSEVYEILRVEAGTPEFGPDIDENTFAPEVGRVARAICYTKGCYLGQEPIVMARDRGHVNRTLLGLRLPAEAPPRGSMLFHNGQEVGRTLSAVVSPRLGAIALAYVRRGSHEPGTTLQVDVAGKRSVTVVSALPIAAEPQA